MRREGEDYDRTCLRLRSEGLRLNRDYSAHFFRWSFVKRMIKPHGRLLDVGCGQDGPILQILTGRPGGGEALDLYVGVDYNKITKKRIRNTFTCEVLDEFDFVNRYEEIVRRHGRSFNYASCLEVIEHMDVTAGKKLLRGIYSCLEDGGTLFLSTPCYDGVHHARNHVHEYTVPELRKKIEDVGFTVVRRFGTFMNHNAVKKLTQDDLPELYKPYLILGEVKKLYNYLCDYYDHDAMACFLAPLFPDQARNNLWVLRREEVMP